MPINLTDIDVVCGSIKRCGPLIRRVAYLVLLPLVFFSHSSVWAHDNAQLSEVIARMKQSVVGIGTHLPTRRPQSRLLGTGFSVLDGGYIVTNYHVIPEKLDEEKYEQLVVFIGQGSHTRHHQARIVLSKPDLDIAILKIDYQLPSVKIAPQDIPVGDGESIAFTGYPIGAVLGLYPVTHTGIVSALSPMAIAAPSAQLLSASKIRRLSRPVMVYQLDATAYPGNSGSPVYLSVTGEVIGILNKVYVKETKEDLLSKPSGISYAIPVKYLRKLLNELELTD